MPGPLLAAGDSAVIKKPCHQRACSNGENDKNMYNSITVGNTCMKQNEALKGDRNGGGAKECCVK